LDRYIFDLEEVEWRGIGENDLAQDRHRLLVIGDAIMNLWFPFIEANFLAS
jgi:hypothetical protein